MFDKISKRGAKEMQMLIPVVVIMMACTGMIMLFLPTHFLLLSMFLVFLAFCPALLYGLDLLEQKYPWLQPYFNPFDKVVIATRRVAAEARANDEKGQISIVGILMAFLTLAVYAALIPAINTVLSQAIANVGPVEATLLSLFHLFMIVTILGTIQFYGPGLVGR